MIRSLTLLLALVAVGCSEAQICRSQATSPLRSLERQIRDAEQNVARGYELIERPGRREYGPEWCAAPPDPPPGTPHGPRPPRGEGGAPWRAAENAAVPAPEAGSPPELVTRRGARSCPSPFPPDPVYEARPINVEAERAKLASLIDQRNRILPATQQALANCPVD